MAQQFHDMLMKRTLVLDGAMGTMLESMGAKGACNEELCLSRPELIADIHRAYLDADADIITTNTFGASAISLADHGLGDKAREINLAAVGIARREADRASTPERPRQVAGEVGPTSKLPTLAHVGFAELRDAYASQMTALIEGGADLILVATCQDPLQAKAAAAAARWAFEAAGRALPLVVSVTIEKIGTMLLGTEISAALAALAPYRLDAFGMNCATGPAAMEEHLIFLSNSSPIPITCRPNAGMPEIVDGRPSYPLGPEEFANILAGYVRRFGIALVGGCCGTTPEHIAALVKELRDDGRKDDGRRDVHRLSFPFVSSLYTAVALDQEPRPFIIAEQTNVNGSRHFKDLLLKSDFDAMAEAGSGAARSSHALDICVAYAGRDERSDLAQLVRRLAVKADASLMIDSTNPDAIEAALELVPGRAIINSINLEDGGKKAGRIISIAQRFGAAVVGLTIDERGMARDAKTKLGVAKRIADLVLGRGLSMDDLFMDPLTFTLASGDQGLRRAGRETLDAIRSIKEQIRGARTLLGVSNISFGLPPEARRVLTSVFLHMALEEGLDAAIINPARIIPLHSIADDDVRLCARLIEGDFSKGDPLAELIERFKTPSPFPLPPGEREGGEGGSPADELRNLIISGARTGVPAILDDILGSMGAAEIINGILLPAMQDVGRRFGEGRLPLPFVLASAEAMRAAIDHLTPHLGAADRVHKGAIVLATVRGDVHDIGKNLVDAIISNNGFRVINLGIRQPAQAIIEAARAQKADAVGLSGLLVSSTEVMRDDLEVFRENGLALPVLLGGAALTESFVDKVLAPAYGGKVYYCADAFAGLVAMEEVCSRRSSARR